MWYGRLRILKMKIYIDGENKKKPRDDRGFFLQGLINLL